MSTRNDCVLPWNNLKTETLTEPFRMLKEEKAFCMMQAMYSSVLVRWAGLINMFPTQLATPSTLPCCCMALSITARTCRNQELSANAPHT